MNDQPVLFSRAAASCRLTLNREDKCHAINEEMIESLDHYLNEIENDTTLRLVELTATGDKFFCAGGDIKSWSTYSPLDMGRKWIKRGNDVFNRLRNLPQLTVANLNGHTIGGGIELALCCDIRIARPNAKLSNPEVMLGMVPGWMGIERVLNQVGPVVGRQMLMLGKRLTAQEALAAQIQDGATIAISGNGGGMVEADHILAAIEARFLQTGHPRNLTLIHSLGIGDRDSKGTNRLAHAEMLKRIIAGHFTWSPKMQELVKNNAIEAYCFPGGVIQALLREIGAGRPGLFTHVGLGSFVDPRNGGGKSNACTTDDLVELIEIDGETKLRYRPFKVDYAILRGTYADPRGNVSLEEEAIDMDSYSMALAAHNSGGKVFVQVRDVLEAGAIEPRRVKLPGILVDGIVEHREQPQTYLGGYDLTISGQHRRLSSTGAIELVSHPVRRLIARRAARELVAGASTNFGFGIPGGIPGVALREGVPYQSLWLSVEQGVHNGMMLDDAFFGCARNADAIIPSLDQFEFYSGGGIDITFLGMGEMDQHGNVNVSHLNGNLIGPGGFLEIAQNAHKVVFCGTFDAKGSKIDVTPDGLHITQSGQIPKLVTQVEKITFSAAYAQQSGQEVLYITERAVFQLTTEGVELIEIAPGVEIDRDILPFMAFRPIIRQPRLMESSLFTPMEDA
ncbi:enoyl-CoA hydratase/isomerase family protein [Escherichia sp. 11.1597]|nr:MULTISPECIES: enoyl-CoA hydratase-related protein [unclassified Escherichia]MBB2423555.1 enoyl-CoA hydratase/isomerase family protein [Escherichia sp. 11.1597]